MTDAQLNAMARDFDQLYNKTLKKIGSEDLDYVRNVKAYSRAIKRRSDALLSHPDTDKAFRKAVILRGLHILLEFNLGHITMHGSYDQIPDGGEFHSSRYKWDFAIDGEAWKTMHHQNHHPYTNIKGLDHDIGFGLFRLNDSQGWWGHNLLQVPGFSLILLTHLAYFSIYTSYSAGAIEGKKWNRLGTYKKAFDVMAKDAVRSYLTEPTKARSRFLPTAAGNLLGNIFGYDYTIFLLVLEHHAGGVSLYEKLDRTETKGEYYFRQFTATTNFVPNARIDLFLQNILEEVDFADRPDFRVFYGALDTHLEHHLFPDLPDNRLREIVPEVKEIAARYGLPYNIIPFETATKQLLQRIGINSAPLARRESPLSLVKSPRKLAQRLYYGLTYREPAEPFYLGVLRNDLRPTPVLASESVIGGQARSFQLEIPTSWQKMEWPAGAFISVQVEIDGESYIRQYSLTHSSAQAQTLDITVKRIGGGLVSNYLNDHVRAGDSLTLFRKPQGEEGFVMEAAPSKPLFIAGGVGITPIMSMIRKAAHDDALDNAQLLYFNSDAESVIFHEEIQSIAAASGLQAQFFYSPSRSQPAGLATAYISKELLEEQVPDLPERTIFICAPDGFISRTKGYLRELDYDMSGFHMEMFKPPEVDRDQSVSHTYHTVKLLKSGKEITINANTTLLDATRSLGVEVLTGCEKGLCKACVCPKVKGTTQLEGDDPDEFLDKITICNALPRSDIELNI